MLEAAQRHLDGVRQTPEPVRDVHIAQALALVTHPICPQSAS
jgi:hypothetical protein